MILLICLPIGVQAQYNIPENSIWAMGEGAGLDFNATIPTPVSTAIYAIEGCASVSNGEYGLRFYTNGETIWNALGSVMPHGDDVLGPAYSTLSTTQGAVIVPAPGSDRYYYTFSLATNGILFCNRIDMSLNNGLGDVDISFPLRYLPIEDSLSEKMIAIPGCNNNVWLLVCGLKSKIYAYEVTVAGLSLTPVISFVNDFRFDVSGMKASPGADRIAICNTGVGGAGMLALFDFDYTNGRVVYDRIVDSSGGGYGCSFSPDGSKLYSTRQQTVFQYNLDDYYPGISKIPLGMSALSSDFKLGVDGKIYFISGNANVGPGTALGRIEHPNILGSAAQYRDTVIDLSPNRIILGFPNEVVLAGNIPPGGINRVVKDTSICTMPSGGIVFNAAPAAGGYTWDNNSTGNTRTVTQAGIYFVRYNTACGTRVDTFKVIDRSINATLQFTKPLLRTESGYTQYRWYKGDTLLTGETGEILSIRSNGSYSVVVENQWGCRDSVSIQVTGYAAIDETEQLSRLISIYPNPTSDYLYIKTPVPVSYRLCGVDGRVYLKGKENTIDIADLAKGLYFLQLYDRNGARIRTEKVLKL
ncbi:T9SS type A sorting domain-containing protein [Taibaiella koreensis]|uniref:T9SS type A sorting domain-containing protein n=1 Tax=Taibaiella koreensis TaxID=1268548 RepID=UPI0019690ECD|nr:T9SS type A sorting domain-containing protein [Taibaiella koreensis]